jgi:hypothetical protein
VTTLVGAESAEVEPTLFVAVTRTRIVQPASPAATTWVAAVAPEMSLQLPPFVLHLRH